MPTDSDGRMRIVYCVGEERPLRDVLPEVEAAALLAAASRAGLRGVRVVDPRGKALWGCGDDVPAPGEGGPRRPILLEGEAVGGIILPAMPGFYHGVSTVHDLVDFVVARICDQLRVPNTLIQRWGETP